MKPFRKYQSLFAPMMCTLAMICGCDQQEVQLTDVTDRPAVSPVIHDSDSIGGSEREFSLRELLKESIQQANVVVPNPDDLNRFSGLIEETIRSTDPLSLRDRWRESGWLLHEDPDSNIVVIAEHPDARHGRGIYAFRLRSDSQLILQAPHRFYDRRTGTIVRKMFLENDVHAAAWNTVHREQVDVAHESRHYLAAFTEAMMRVDDELAVIQLHGFANKSRSANARNAKVIVSNSTRFPGRLARDVAISLKEEFGVEQVLLFPLEVSELGGTTNAQASIVRGTGNPNFLHLEINSELRQQIEESASIRGAFFGALEGRSEFETANR
ncbi:MAG: hypothetical protein AAF456_07745 [Planctomycetota bacterium]